MKLPKNLLSGWPIAVVLTLLMLLMHLLQWQPLSTLENKTYDLRQKMRQGKPRAPVVIVAVDDPSILKLGRWPWPRTYMAELIDYVASGKPSVIGLNVLYTEPERNVGLDEIRTIKKQMESGGRLAGQLAGIHAALSDAEKRLDSDAELAGAILAAKNVLLPLFVTAGELSDGDLNFPPTLKKNALEAPKSGSYINAVEETLPIAPFMEAAMGLGHINLFPDHDGVLRNEPLFVQYKGHILPSLSMQAALAFSNKKLADLTISSDRIAFGQVSIPVDSKGRMQVDFRGKFGTYQYYSFIDVREGRISPDVFKNKIVLIGMVATGIASLEVTPVQPSFPGIEITANAIETILTGTTISRPSYSTPIEMLLMLIIGAFLAVALPRLKAAVSAVVSAVVLLIWNGVAIWLFVSQGQWLAMVAPSVLLAVGYTIITSTRFMVTEKGKELVESDSIETNKMLGLSFQGQGLLDLAFEKFRKCPIDDGTIKDLLYNLALDFERKRMFNKAAAVYEHILSAGDYKDIKERIGTMKQAGETMIFGAPGGRKENTVILQGGGAALPTIGRFEIQKELGRGAMGTVYLGRDPKINRMVAIKTIRFDEIEQEQIQEVKQRFFREAEAAGALNHPNIVTIYDVGEDYDLAYVAMELLDGSDLCDFVKPTQRLPFAEVLRIVGCVAEGLDFANSKGIVHRDIKPANIMRLKNGDIKIADFGIARITASSSTQTGMILGTPSYMSPEQVMGQKVDGRSDLFSLGVAMYELLSCRKPFTGDSITNIMFNIANKPPLLLTKIDPDIPECCAFIAHKLLMKDITKRYQAGREVAEHCKICRQKLG
ncbi:MAG: CHASE2 domain-containing protein [Deltaproteobacteria bacterium]|nr:CHASE2 domain-containing protein [Deltaproteobacteria bacterium]